MCKELTPAEITAKIQNLEHQYHQLTRQQKINLRVLLEQIARSYSNDPGTSDLYDDKWPVSLSITLGDVRLVRQLVPGASKTEWP